MHSEQLGLDLVQQGDTMRFFDPRSGAFLLTLLEAAQRAASAEAEIARLRAELAALRESQNGV